MFEKGIKEHSIIENMNGRDVFRYMGPLFVEKGCMPCHARQGYKIGHVRGGISVAFDISKIQKQLKANKILIIEISVVTFFSLILIIFISVVTVADQ